MTSFSALIQALNAHPATPVISQFMSVISNIVIALPAIWGLKTWLGWKKGLLIFAGLGIFAWSFEAFAVLTGWPYSPFTYGEVLPGKIFGLVPWTVPFAWVPLLLGSAWLAHTRIPQQKIWIIVLSTAIFTTLIDVVLDPAATAFSFWNWQRDGWWYGVPLQNYFGWFVSAIIGSCLLERSLRGKSWTDAPKTLAVSAGISLTLWTTVCFFLQFWTAAVIGILLTVGFWYVWNSQRKI